ncbi:hypothetical protein NDU88_001163 [Pleurodeles waltl]|uniref:Uncharacterized protein n=1 Tax=Pleurodeles waltl TaxID=8319 RepID=A0AAV7USK4_PLEWA|nr:hypothetical protein NDU88_001163 [Pleurodeles waltl]
MRGSRTGELMVEADEGGRRSFVDGWGIIKINPVTGSAGPSVEAACADTAVDDPELKNGGASPFLLPVLKGARRGGQEMKNANEEGGGTADEEENAEDAGFSERDDEQRERYPVQHLETAEGEDATEALTAAQEAHSEDSSHASGEAWHRQLCSGTG